MTEMEFRSEDFGFKSISGSGAYGMESFVVGLQFLKISKYKWVKNIINTLAMYFVDNIALGL